MLSLFPGIYAQLQPESNGQGENPIGASGYNNVDCSDPLMADSSQCFGLTQGGANPLGYSGSSGGMINTYGMGNSYGPSAAPQRNYTDVEQLSQQMGARMQTEPLAPEPLTEFQKFIASTTGQILPVYGADLFRRVPTTFSPMGMTPVPADYVLGPGDELRIRIWGQVNNQANLRVDRSGDIYLPQVGPIHVAGLPYSDLEVHLREAVGRVYKNFNLTVDMGQIRSIQVYVTGEARRPGLYTVSSLSTLVNAIFSSGGPSVDGSLRRIEVRRNGAEVSTFDLYDLLLKGDKSKDVKLLDGDVIYIPPVGPQAAVTGSVAMPGIYELLKGEPLGNLLKDAGGATAVASDARISIERIDNRRDREAMEVADDAPGLSSPLQDGDLIRVYSIVPMYQKTVTLRGNVANPGRFAWHAGMRISALIPDKDSLLTRNYWWRRAQLGLPAPEFAPLQGLSTLRQPVEGYPTQVPPEALEHQQDLLEEQQNQNAKAQRASETPQAGQPASPAAEAALAQTQTQSQAQTGSPDQNLPASQRPASATLAAAQTNINSETRSPHSAPVSSSLLRRSIGITP